MDTNYSQTLEVQVPADAGDDGIWGRLVSLNSRYPHIDLHDNEVTLGRLPECTARFDDKRISGKHCKIIRMPDQRRNTGSSVCQDVILVEDLSSNGTFLNRAKIGKGNRSVMAHGSELSLVAQGAQPKQGGSFEDSSITYHFHDLTRPPSVDVPKSEIEQHYDIQRVLGTGNFASVNLGIRKSTGEKFAVKIIDKKKFKMEPNLRPEQLRDEVEILRKLQHPNIVMVHEVFETDDQLYLVMELIAGGELFDAITERKFSENDARRCFTAILRAVAYLHDNNIAHRDLKPENVLLRDKEDVTSIKISDFGLARVFGGSDAMKTMCGTPQYLAPEVLVAQQKGGTYGKECDLWSLGVILYILLCGCFPFFESRDMSLYERILKGLFQYPEKLWKDISPDAKDLINKLLTVDPVNRLTAVQALQHPWLAVDVEMEDASALRALPSVANLKALMNMPFPIPLSATGGMPEAGKSASTTFTVPADQPSTSTDPAPHKTNDGFAVPHARPAHPAEPVAVAEPEPSPAPMEETATGRPKRKAKSANLDTGSTASGTSTEDTPAARTRRKTTKK